MKESLVGVWEVKNSPFKVEDSTVTSESKDSTSPVDGKYIIGRVEGPMFVPNGVSRNGRYYSKKLWENTLKDPEVIDRLSRRVMYGSIGHDDEPFSDIDLRNGKNSHFITKLWIDEETGLGMGEALILNNDIGRNLLTCLKAGSLLCTSTRAYGEYKEGVQVEGVPVIDEATYQLHTIDFVIDPGFLQATPKLMKESVSEGLDEGLDEGFMIEENNKSLTESVKFLLQENENRKALLAQESHNRLVEELKVVKEKAIKYASIARKLSEKVKSMEAFEKKFFGDVSKCESLLRSLRIGRADRVLEALKSVGGASVLKNARAFNISLESLRGLSRLSGTRDMSKAVKAIESRLRNVSKTPSSESSSKELQELRKVVKEYRDLGSLKEVREAAKLLEAYVSIGSPKAFEFYKNKARTLGKTAKINSSIKVVEALSKDSGVPVEKVRKMVESLGAKEASRVLSSMSFGKSNVKEKSPESKLPEALSVADKVLRGING